MRLIYFNFVRNLFQIETQNNKNTTVANKILFICFYLKTLLFTRPIFFFFFYYVSLKKGF